MTQPLSSPVAVVTGAGAARVGNCVARALADHGYRLAIHANRSLSGATSTAEELTTAGSESIAVAADLSDERQVTEMFETVLDRFGQIDALVNCAAIYEATSLEDVTAEDVRRHFDANTLGTFLCCQQAGKAMVRQTSGGAIVNLGDWATVRPYADYSAYFASKGAIPTLTRCFAVELARRNPRVRVNAILPGPVLFPEDLPEAERRVALANTLVKHEGSPENVAHAVLFLLQNDYVTGVCLPVDGGRSVYSE